MKIMSIIFSTTIIALTALSIAFIVVAKEITSFQGLGVVFVILTVIYIVFVNVFSLILILRNKRTE